MKKLLVVLGCVLWSLFATAQVENCMIRSRYTDFYEYDYTLEEYRTTGGDWMNCYIMIDIDYYVIEIPSYDPATVYWEYMKQTDDRDEVYETADGRKVVFRYSTQVVIFFYEYNEYNYRFDKCMVLSKTSKIDE